MEKKRSCKKRNGKKQKRKKSLKKRKRKKRMKRKRKCISKSPSTLSAILNMSTPNFHTLLKPVSIFEEGPVDDILLDFANAAADEALQFFHG